MLITLLAIGIVLTGIVFGAWKGFAWQLAGVVALILGWCVALPLAGPVAPTFGLKAPLNKFIAIAVLYALTSFGVYFVALLFRKVLERWQLQHWDRHLGAVLGGVKGWLLCLVAIFFAVTLSSRARGAVLTTPVGKWAAVTMDMIHPVFPHEVHEILHPYVHGLEEAHPHHR